MVMARLSENGLSLSDDVVESIVEKTMMEADTKRDGKIDEEEWREFVKKNPSILKIMTLSNLKTCFLCFLDGTDTGVATLIQWKIYFLDIMFQGNNCSISQLCPEHRSPGLGAMYKGDRLEFSFQHVRKFKKCLVWRTRVYLGLPRRAGSMVESVVSSATYGLPLFSMQDSINCLSC
ncbi:hypothetical protein V6N11_036423 [Hibiscus sabdariffa]|uniref:Calcineurin B-like protein n=1 Tax=Hibiscus sabdariffa TaxID=183260 RepID=A0ABR2RAE1_9ROSI